MPRVAALLAAGAGTRFAGKEHKLTSELRGRAVWEWALQNLLEAQFDQVIVVTGATELTVPDGIFVVSNPDWASGQATSLLAAVIAADGLGADAVTVGLADQPFVTGAAWRAVGTADATCRIVVADYDGAPGPHPVRLARDVWPLLSGDGDDGARTLLSLHPEWVCHVPCVGSVADIDTMEDLERWNNC